MAAPFRGRDRLAPRALPAPAPPPCSTCGHEVRGYLIRGNHASSPPPESVLEVAPLVSPNALFGLLFERDRYADSMPTTSAGFLVFRLRARDVEVFLVHPGGPVLEPQGLGRLVDPEGRDEPQGRPIDCGAP